MKKRSGNCLNIIIFIAVASVIYTFFLSPSRPISAEDLNLTSENISLERLADPIQENYRGNGHVGINKKDLKIKIYPKAKYRIYAMVMSKKGYNSGWEAMISPYDLALGWNKLMLPENQKGIRYSQSGRWYHYRYDGSFPLSKTYIRFHSSNHHIIPNNDNLKKALNKIRVKEKVYLEGYLVSIKGTYKGGNVWWNSSLSRKDTGDGSCEVFYLTKAIIRNEIYK